jgi:hypothetical protein
LKDSHDRRGSCPEHQPDNKQGGVVSDILGYQQNEQEHTCGAGACGGGYRPRVSESDGNTTSGHNENGHHQAGAGGEAKDIGACEGISKEGLHEQAGYGQGRSGQHTGDGYRQAEFIDQVAGGVLISEKRIDHVGGSERDAPDQQAEEKEGGQGESQPQPAKSIRSFLHTRK